MQSALLFLACHEQITRMCFLLRCQFFPLPVTDGSQCYYRNRLIFLMSQFNRLQNLDVAAHPCQTICTHKTFSETNKKKPLLSGGPVLYSISYSGSGGADNQRRGACRCKQDAGNTGRGRRERPVFSRLRSNSHKMQVHLHNMFSCPFLRTLRKSVCHLSIATHLPGHPVNKKVHPRSKLVHPHSGR